MTPPSRWVIGGGFWVEAESQEDAERALEAIERAGNRAPASVNLYVHESGEADR